MRQQCPESHWFDGAACPRCEWVPPEPPEPPAVRRETEGQVSAPVRDALAVMPPERLEQAHDGFTKARKALAEAKQAKGVK